jgi:hypothetical protein
MSKGAINGLENHVIAMMKATGGIGGARRVERGMAEDNSQFGVPFGANENGNSVVIKSDCVTAGVESGNSPKSEEQTRDVSVL